MKPVVCTNGAFVVVYRINPSSFKLEVLLGQRRSNRQFELFGGQVDYELDDVTEYGPFASCASRECAEEGGLTFEPDEPTQIALFQQRVLYQDVYLIGTVVLFAVYFAHDHEHSSDEVIQTQWRVVDETLFKDENVSTASLRMIAHFSKYYEARSQGKNPRLISANLGAKVVIRNGSGTYAV